MQKIKTKSVSPGIAIGKLFVINRKESLKDSFAQDKDEELQKLAPAVTKAKEEILELKNRASDAEKEIFDAHILMLDDEMLNDEIKSNLECGYDITTSVYHAKDKIKQIFLDMDDDYFRARAMDVEDVLMRLIRILSGEKKLALDEESILISDEIYPSEALELDFNNVVGIVTKFGSVTSHTTILANNLKIPALIGCDVDYIKLDGKMAIIDTFEDILIIDPDENTIHEYKNRREELLREDEELKKYINMEAKTKSGQKIGIFANIGNDEEAKIANENGAEGIGLFRSEFLFLGRDSAPTEEEQFNSYKNALINMEGKPVIIRTLDIGADKNVSYLNQQKEDNPQMGLRAIRISLNNIELFKTQLKALLRASLFGDLRVMLPMIVSREEIKMTKKIIEECKKELSDENIPYKDFKLGIMIETPAAALDADNLAKEVEFFSIGTNDLVSYTLAVDRTNTLLDSTRDERHPAVIRLIKMIAEAAKKNNIEVGICGAMGADEDLLPLYIELGFDELSVSINKILKLKKGIINS